MSEKTNDLVRTLAKGSGVLIVGFVLELGLSFVAKVLLAQILGKVTYGSLSIGIVMAANLSTIFVLGMNTGLARYLPMYDGGPQRRGVLVSAYQVVVPVALLVGLLVFVFAEPIAQYVVRDRSVAPVIRVFAVATPFATLLKLNLGAIRGTKAALPKVLVRNIAQPVARFALILLALYMGYRAYGVGVAYLAAYLVAALLALYYVHRRTPLLSRGEWVPMHRELLDYSAPLAVMAVASLIVTGVGIDSFMIAYFAETAQVGDYNVIVPAANLMVITVSAVSFLFMPIMSELQAEGAESEMARLFEVVTKWIVLGTLPIFAVFLFFPGQFLALTFGSEYSTAALSLSVLSVGYFVHAAVGPNKRVLNSIGETRLVMWDNIAAAGVNVVFNLLLVPPYGLLGAALGTMAAYVTVNALYSYHVYRTTGMHPFSESLVRPTAAALVVIGGASLLAKSTVTIDGFGLIALAVFLAPFYVLVVLWAGAVDEEEVILVLSFEERFGVDLGPVKYVANRIIGN